MSAASTTPAKAPEQQPAKKDDAKKADEPAAKKADNKAAVAGAMAAANGAKSPTTGAAAKPKAGGNASAAAAAAAGTNYGAILLRNQLKELSKNPVDGFSIGLSDDDNIYEWKVMMEGPAGTPFEGGMFRCSLSFPKEYPNKPPVMKFLTPGFWHPNVYPDGKVCISILHEAKEDVFNTQEKMSEKWRPILGVEAVLVSVQSMLSDPNFDSPANIDASVELKKDPAAFKRRIRQLVRKSQELL